MKKILSPLSPVPSLFSALANQRKKLLPGTLLKLVRSRIEMVGRLSLSINIEVANQCWGEKGTMNAKGLKKRVEKIEKAMEPTFAEALSWVEQANPPAGRVLRKALAIKAESESFIRFPSGPMSIAEWERQCLEADEARRKRDEKAARDRIND
jgi:hypothetical protein